MNRRELLGTGAGLALATPFAVAAAQWSSAGPVAAVVSDARFPQSARYAELVGGSGCITFDRGEDLMALCRNDLAPWLQSRSGPGLRLAGLTQYSDFLVLRDVARDAGLRQVRIVQHDGARKPVPGYRTVSLTAWMFAQA